MAHLLPDALANLGMLALEEHISSSYSPQRVQPWRMHFCIVSSSSADHCPERAEVFGHWPFWHDAGPEMISLIRPAGNGGARSHSVHLLVFYPDPWRQHHDRASIPRCDSFKDGGADRLPGVDLHVVLKGETGADSPAQLALPRRKRGML